MRGNGRGAACLGNSVGLGPGDFEIVDHRDADSWYLVDLHQPLEIELQGRFACAERDGRDPVLNALDAGGELGIVGLWQRRMRARARENGEDKDDGS
jgi:hypothetical protein